MKAPLSEAELDAILTSARLASEGDGEGFSWASAEEVAENVARLIAEIRALRAAARDIHQDGGDVRNGLRRLRDLLPKETT